MSEHVVKIKPRSSLFDLNLGEFWAYRELIALLVVRDLKVRYKQTILGVLWAVLQPVLTAAVFTIVFSKLAGDQKSEVPYMLYALSGFTFWTFVSSSLSFGGNSLLQHKDLVTRVYFPRLIIPGSAVGAYFLDLLLTLLIVFAAMAYFRIAPTVNILLLPVCLIFVLLIALSISCLIAALNVRFRDIKFVIPFALQFWLFLSPVFYPSDWINGVWRYVFALNPLSGCLDLFRFALFGSPLNITTLSISVAVTLLLSVLSIVVFRRLEDDFADLL